MSGVIPKFAAIITTVLAIMVIASTMILGHAWFIGGLVWPAVASVYAWNWALTDARLLATRRRPASLGSTPASPAARKGVGA